MEIMEITQEAIIYDAKCMACICPNYMYMCIYVYTSAYIHIGVYVCVLEFPKAVPNFNNSLG